MNVEGMYKYEEFLSKIAGIEVLVPFILLTQVVYIVIGPTVGACGA